MTERERKSGVDPRGEIQKGSTSGTAVGAKLGRTKGNKREAKYIESEEKHGKPGESEEEKPGSESGRAKRGSRCEAETWKSGTEETESQVAGSGAKADERKQKQREKCGKRKLEANTCGTAVGAKQGRAKRNIQQSRVRKTGRKAWETRQDRRWKAEDAKAETAHGRSHCEAGIGREGKEETEAE